MRRPVLLECGAVVPDVPEEVDTVTHEHFFGIASSCSYSCRVIRTWSWGGDFLVGVATATKDCERCGKPMRCSSFPREDGSVERDLPALCSGCWRAVRDIQEKRVDHMLEEMSIGRTVFMIVGWLNGYVDRFLRWLR